MILGLALLVPTMALRMASGNRHVRGRLTISAIAFAAYSLMAAALAFLRLSPASAPASSLSFLCLSRSASSPPPLPLLVNPWRADRLPERFPNIVQDTMVIGLFAIVATVILQDRVFATTAVGAVVIGFALQDTLGNLFAGLAIQIEKPFRVGHWVRIAEVDGLVSEITWRATKVRTKAGNFVIVPNSTLSKDAITNYSEPTLETRIEVEVGASYDAAPNYVKTTILDALKHEPLILATRPARSAAARLRRLGDRLQDPRLVDRFFGRRAGPRSSALGRILRVPAQGHLDSLSDSGPAHRRRDARPPHSIRQRSRACFAASRFSRRSTTPCWRSWRARRARLCSPPAK